MTDQLELLTDLLDASLAAGADAADAVMAKGASLSVRWRMGELEQLERSENNDLGLRVFVGRRQAVVSSTDFSRETLKDVVDRVVAMARAAPEDCYCGLAEPGEISTDPPDIDLHDSFEPDADSLIEAARTAEEAGRAVQGVTNSEGAEASWGRAGIALAATNGFARAYQTTNSSLGVSMLAGEGLEMERDYDYSTAVYYEDLDGPADLGRAAGERAVRRLGARKVETREVPVIYDPRVSRGLLGHLAGAINGAAISRGTSFLQNELGNQVFGNKITVIDDPHRDRGLGSLPFDGECLPNRRRSLVENGVLTSWILDLASARQLELSSTGHAVRGMSGPPSPSASNLHMEPGDCSPEDLITDIVSGFYVTELMGQGVNLVTGDYSRGASGFWIENGEIAWPVSEMTIAGNLKNMFATLTPANDLVFRYRTNMPTVRIDGMTVAGV